MNTLKKNKNIFFIILISIIIGITISAGFFYWNKHQRISYTGDSFLKILKKENYKDNQSLYESLSNIEKDGLGVYPFLARFYRASLLSYYGDQKNAIINFDKISSNISAPEILRKLALLRSAYLLIDQGSFVEIKNRVKIFIDQNDPMRFPAYEILGFSSWKNGDIKTAKFYFKKIYEDSDSLNTGFYQRSDMMLSLIQNNLQ